jgi:hypothetical protein
MSDPAQFWTPEWQASERQAVAALMEGGTVVATGPNLADPWDACLDVDPFTGQPDHVHGESCDAEECCE